MDYADYYSYSRVHVQKEKAVNKEIAFFDFDGTITTKDTLLEFIKFSKGALSFYLGFLVNLPFLIAYKLKIISNQKAKEKILYFFFHGTHVSDFNQYCLVFYQTVLPKLIRPKALEEIRRLQRENIIVVVVSASPENWIQNWALDVGTELIATRLEIIDEKLTGKLLGKNCHGNEKVCRIKDLYDLSKYRVVAAYGDSVGDKPMLKLAFKSHYKPFGPGKNDKT
jgi:phosphatidylglycerophosphatase C